MATSAPDLLTIPEAADRLACSPGAVRKWLRQGRLPAVKLGRAVRLRAADVAKVIAGEGIPATSARR